MPGYYRLFLWNERREILDRIPLVMNSYFMSELTTVTVSRKGQALLPLKWRKTFGLESGGPCDARELNDGKGSLPADSAPKKTARRERTARALASANRFAAARPTP